MKQEVSRYSGGSEPVLRFLAFGLGDALCIGQLCCMEDIETTLKTQSALELWKPMESALKMSFTWNCNWIEAGGGSIETKWKPLNTCNSQ